MCSELPVSPSSSEEDTIIIDVLNCWGVFPLQSNISFPIPGQLKHKGRWVQCVWSLFRGCRAGFPHFPLGQRGDGARLVLAAGPRGVQCLWQGHWPSWEVQIDQNCCKMPFCIPVWVACSRILLPINYFFLSTLLRPNDCNWESYSGIIVCVLFGDWSSRRWSVVKRLWTSFDSLKRIQGELFWEMTLGTICQAC